MEPTRNEEFDVVRKYDFDITLNIKNEYNYLCYQCDTYYKMRNSTTKQTPYSLIESIIIENKEEVDFKDLRLEFIFSNTILGVSDIYLSIVNGKSKTKVTEGIMTKVDTMKLYNNNESLPVNLLVRLYDKEKLLKEVTHDIIITPMNESSHIVNNYEMLSCFVTPNISEITEVIRHATKILSEIRNKDSAFIGYQANDIDSVREEMMAIYNALKSLNINYANPPASFNLFQSVRLPKTVLNEKFGTCLDLAILYCACLENVGLNPILVLVDGHAFAGCFLNDDCFIEKTCNDIGKVFNESASDNLAIELVECTMFTSSINQSFNASNQNARSNIRLYSGFFCAIDILSCHKAIYRPIPSIEKNENGEFVINLEVDKQDDLKKKNSDTNQEVFEGIEKSDKFNYWSKKLLDLSLRNKLINFKIGPSSPQLVYDNASKMLEALLKKDKIYLYPNDIVLPANTYYEYDSNSNNTALNDKGVYLICTNDQLLKSLFRAGNSSIEETGSNNLYLSFGLINFAPKNSKKSLVAPVFLIPVRGKSKRTVNGYELLVDSDNIAINTTVFEYLHQTCDISFDELYNIDKQISKLNISSIFNTIRNKTTPECMIAVDDNKVFLSTFSFANYILWEDIHNRKEQLLENEIIRSLVDGKELSKELEMEFDVDKDFNPDDLAIPLSADSSQIKAIALATKGESFVLDGPPGTGKSQTIVNMIINAMYNGKTVLFVAEKMAALEVVKKRIDDINLGCFCLELHSHKANKRGVLDQIAKALANSHTKSPKEFSKQMNELSETRTYLNDFIKRIHEKSLLYSLHDAIVNYYTYEEYLLDLQIKHKDYLKITAESLEKINNIYSKLSTIKEQYGEYIDLPFYAFDLSNYIFTMKEELHQLILNLKDKLKVLVVKLNEFKDYINANVDFSFNNVLNLIKMLEIALTSKLSLNSLFSNEILLNHETSLKVIEKGIENDLLKDKLLKVFNSDILNIPANDLISKINNSNFITRIFVNFKIKKELKTYLKNKNFKLTNIYIGEVLENILSYQLNLNYINQNNTFLMRLFQDDYKNLSNNYTLMKEYYDNTYLFKQYFDKLEYQNELEDNLFNVINSFKVLVSEIKNDDISKYKLQKVIEVYNAYQLAEEALVNNFDLNPNKFIFKDSNFAYQEYDKIVSLMDKNISKFESISLYNKYLIELEKSLFPAQLISYYKEGKCSLNDLIKHFTSNLNYALINEYFKDYYFIEFSGLMFDNAIRKYNELLDQYTELIITETASKITKNYPINNFDYAKSSNIYGLQKCIKNGGHKTTIRNILIEYGKLIRKICPCFLMSPMSAAQYLSLDSEKFDLVIFDEASQIPTCEAIGAISRGKSLIVAGDPEQMPPTSFFQTVIGNNDVTEIASNFDDLESLLDDCLALGMRRNRLLWHYRSSHESLIAFSNNTFYEHSLYTFPSPDNLERKVTYEYVGGVYESGKNVLEAEAILKEVERRFKDPTLCKQTIGIVTFNLKQQELILEMINNFFESNPEYNEINESNKDKLFVKNLENVQGDERDIILFSVGFGFNKEKKFHLHFGPLSLEKGERRLNVAVTRSKMEMKVFASIHGSDINTAKTKNRGAEVLKEFLLYAEYGSSYLIMENSYQSTCHVGIERELQEELLKRGIDSDILVGDSKFKLNLCVKDAFGNYTLGIICDGGVNSQDSSCRDRNCVQIKTLQRLNWNIINIYSIDYIKNKEQVIDMIIEAVDKKNQIIDVMDNSIDIIFEKEIVEVYKRAKTYQKYNFSIHFNYDAIVEEYIQTRIVNELTNIIDFEGPIAYTLLLERFKELLNVSKAGARVKRLFDKHLAAVKREKKLELSQVIYFPKDLKESQIDYYRVSDNTLRDILEIPACEIKVAMKDILELQGSVKYEDITHILANFFGIKALTQSSNEKLSKLIKYVVLNSSEFIVKDNYLKLKK